MIKFACILCGERISVQEQLAGRRITCPKCNSTSVVPSESPRIKFTCKNCGQGIRVFQIHAGKEGKCPKCQSPIVVPSLTADPVDGSETVIFVCSMCSETIKAPKGSKERFTECPQCGSNVETSLRGEPVESDSSIPQDTDEDEYDDESDVYEEETGPDRRVIFVISGAALVVVVGLIILITVMLPSSSGTNENSVGPARQEIIDADSRPQTAVSNSRPAGTFTLGPPEESVAAKPPAGSPAATGGGVPDQGLLLRLETGQKHSVRMINEEKFLQTDTEERMDVITTKTTELEFEVEDVEPNGVARLKVTYLALKEKTEGQVKQQHYEQRYDSTMPDAPTEHPFAPMFSAMIGQSFLARVTREGTVLGLEGVDEMYLRMAEKMEPASERGGPRQRRVQTVLNMLRKNPIIAKEEIAQIVGNLIVAYPGGAVETGDSWQARKILFYMGDVHADCTYTLKEKTRALIVVGVSSKIDVNDEPVDAEGNTLGSTRTTLKGTYEGILEIDPSTGWMLRKKATMNCSGQVIMPPNAQMPQGMTLPVTMASIITVEPIR